MDIDTLFREFQIYNNLLAILLGMPRLFVIVQIVPFMAGSILTGQLRATVVLSCYLVLHPTILAQLSPHDAFSTALLLNFVGLAIKEALIGFLLAYLAGIVFWVVQCAGFFIDNQRGAGQASVTDPLAGEQTSPIGSFLFQGATYMFFSTGAFLAFLGLIYASYEIWPVTSLLPADVFRDMRIPVFFAKKVAYMMTHVMLLAGPVVVACLLTDVSLGLINRFASQLNVYVLAMPIKSGVAAFLLLLYFGMVMSGTLNMFHDIDADVQYLRMLIP